MLKTMRDSFHHLKWVLLAVVAAFIFGFVFIDMGLGGATGGSTDESAAFAARVNGDSISYNEFYRAMKNYEDMYRQMYGQQFTPEMAQAMGLPRQVLDTLVDQRLMLQEAERLDLQASPEEVRAKLLEIPIFTQDGKFIGMELYKRYVTGPMGYASTADFEADLARDIVLQKIESALMNSVVVTPGAADAEYRRVSENAKIRYALLPAARLAASINVTPAEVDAFYAKNQGRYAHSEQRQVRYLLADTARLRSQIVPTDPEIRQFYDSKKEELKTADAARVLHILVKVDPAATPEVDAAARAKAQGLVQQLRAGADFATLARQNSDDPSSSGNGGEMGFVERGQTVEPFEKAIFSITANTISDPIRTPEYGYHIVKVVERRPAGYRPFEEVKGQLASQLADQKANDQAREAISRVSAQVRENKPKSVDAFVALANATVSSNDTGFFQKSEPIPGIGSNPTLSQWIFAAKQGDIGEVTGTSRGIIIPYVAGVRPAGVTPLAEIRARVEQDAR
ncbi:MAG: SurA N-terminal domain-containing protein, partial [Thermoanaerobaculia bacterium]